MNRKELHQLTTLHEQTTLTTLHEAKHLFHTVNDKTDHTLTLLMAAAYKYFYAEAKTAHIAENERLLPQHAGFKADLMKSVELEHSKIYRDNFHVNEETKEEIFKDWFLRPTMKRGFLLTRGATHDRGRRHSIATEWVTLFREFLTKVTREPFLYIGWQQTDRPNPLYGREDLLEQSIHLHLNVYLAVLSSTVEGISNEGKAQKALNSSLGHEGKFVEGDSEDENDDVDLWWVLNDGRRVPVSVKTGSAFTPEHVIQHYRTTQKKTVPVLYADQYGNLVHVCRRSNEVIQVRIEHGPKNNPQPYVKEKKQIWDAAS